jgi:NADPH:quinone reductase-like Zn-dependent oxidoreductase
MRYPFRTLSTRLAARAYINPLAAQMMLTRYPPRGKRVLLTAAGSDCAILLGQWARQAGAEAVYGIHRSAVHAERLEAMGITPVAQHDAHRIGTVAARSDIVYDATGGPLAEAILSVMPEPGMFVATGCSPGKPSHSGGLRRAWRGSISETVWMRSALRRGAQSSTASG